MIVIDKDQYSETVANCISMILKKCIEYAADAPRGEETPQQYVLKRLIAISENSDNKKR